MSKSIEARTKKYSIASAVLALLLLAFQFVPYWDCSTEISKQTGGAVVETPYGYWKYNTGEVPLELKPGYKAEEGTKEVAKEETKEAAPVEEAKKEKETTAEKLVAEGEKLKSRYSIMGYVWGDFRKSALLESLSLECGQVVNFTSLLTFNSMILLTTILAIAFCLAKPKSILSAIAADLCGTVGLLVLLFVPAATASFTSILWVLQLVIGLALKVLAVAKYVLWARRNDEA